MAWHAHWINLYMLCEVNSVIIPDLPVCFYCEIERFDVHALVTKNQRKFVHHHRSAHFFSGEGGFLWFIFMHQMVLKWETIHLLLSGQVDWVQIHQVQVQIHWNWVQILMQNKSWKWMSQRLMKLKWRWSHIWNWKTSKMKTYIKVWSMVLSLLVIIHCMWSFHQWQVHLVSLLCEIVCFGAVIIHTNFLWSDKVRDTAISANWVVDIQQAYDKLDTDKKTEYEEFGITFDKGLILMLVLPICYINLRSSDVTNGVLLVLVCSYFMKFLVYDLIILFCAGN